MLRIAHEVLEKNPGAAKLAVVGIHTRGAHLGARVHKLLCELDGRQCSSGSLDISFYRDDVAARGAGAASIVPHVPQPVVRDTDLPFDVEGTAVVLVDDVLYTGRTIRRRDRGALRPRPAGAHACSSRSSWTAATASCRSVPDYVGKNIPTARDKRVPNVRLVESDGVDEVVLARREGE